MRFGCGFVCFCGFGFCCFGDFVDFAGWCVFVVLLYFVCLELVFGFVD